MGKMPKVSVITGYYNRCEHLELTVRSILDQSFEDLELIVFDDASTDSTEQRIRAIQNDLRDPRLRIIIHARNKGFTQGMIDAIARSAGKYVAVQGSGDISLPGRIRRQFDLLESRPEVGVVGCWYTNVVSSTGARRQRRPNAHGLDLGQLLQRNVFSHGEVMFRRSVYDAAGGYRPAFRNCQDYDLWLRMVKLTQFATIPENLYERYIRFDGVSYDPRKFARQARYFLLAQRFAAMTDDEGDRAVAKLAAEGPLSLIPSSDPALQARYVKAALRSIIWGACTEAAELARNNIKSTFMRAALVTGAKLFDSPVGRPFRKIAELTFGVR